MRRRYRWGLMLALGIPLATLAAQGFRRGRRAPGMDPNPNVAYDGRLTFVRVKFEPLGGGWDLKWDHDYPRSETHFMKILDELTTIKPTLDGSNIFGFDDPEIFKFPIGYVSEPGFWTMNEKELAGVRAYVQKGGFLIFDDFAGEHWFNFERRWQEAFPELRLVQLDTLHPILDSFFRIRNLSIRHPNPQYSGLATELWGAFEDNDPARRLVMIATYNNDLGDYIEFSDEQWLPVPLTNRAYQLMVNYYVYAVTH